MLNDENQELLEMMAKVMANFPAFLEKKQREEEAKGKVLATAILKFTNKEVRAFYNPVKTWFKERGQGAYIAKYLKDGKIYYEAHKFFGEGRFTITVTADTVEELKKRFKEAANDKARQLYQISKAVAETV